MQDGEPLIDVMLRARIAHSKGSASSWVTNGKVRVDSHVVKNPQEPVALPCYIDVDGAVFKVEAKK